MRHGGMAMDAPIPTPYLTEYSSATASPWRTWSTEGISVSGSPWHSPPAL